MAWQLLAAALPAVAKVAGTALNKPKQEDFKANTGYMKKYVSFLRGRSSNREVVNQAMQPAIKMAGRQGRQMQQQIGYDTAKSGLGGSGIEAQMRLSAGQQTQDALATATDKAVAAQTADTARIGEQAAGITAQIGAEEARAEQAYKQAQSQYKSQLTSDVIGLGASVASAGITQAGKLNEAKLMAVRSGYFGSEADVQKMIDQKWSSEMFTTERTLLDQRVNALLGSGLEINDITKELGLGAGYTGMSNYNSGTLNPNNAVKDAVKTVVTDVGSDANSIANASIGSKVKTKVEPQINSELEDDTTALYNETMAKSQLKTNVKPPRKKMDFKLPDGSIVKTGSVKHKNYLKNFKTKAQKKAMGIGRIKISSDLKNKRLKLKNDNIVVKAVNEENQTITYTNIRLNKQEEISFDNFNKFADRT